MAQFNLEVTCDNSAFEPDTAGELARILAEVSEKLRRGEADGVIRDINGNLVGSFNYSRQA